MRWIRIVCSLVALVALAVAAGAVRGTPTVVTALAVAPAAVGAGLMLLACTADIHGREGRRRTLRAAIGFAGATALSAVLILVLGSTPELGLVFAGAALVLAAVLPFAARASRRRRRHMFEDYITR